ncbi:putative toxin-antitoxin system toxin component, PIN family [Spirosoma pollinicola]|uniref:Putative toxin-antitoxin system toxin component, PIN family n=1 Tax=Spirosoma pollinicola TaxID=2057025 RepID=A0A2K8Z4F5_9BACT|nr:putative toxin-antitoxin system toxin component, PIN family [Spirosoma pollinicola]AUD04753.1 putative toxin-antitoxin system toxin component, PIN family [Spirosoma pollinicola]
MRVVIDTNCFLAIIPKISPYRRVFDSYRSQQFELAVSNEITEEYAEIFEKRMTRFIADNLLELVDKQPNTAKTEICYRWGLITADYDDNKFVDCAVSAGADYIVTNDRHFDVLQTKKFPSVQCLTLTEFIACPDA